MTADQPRVRVTTNLAFGICLILLGTSLVLDRLRLVDATQVLRFWPVALVLFGAALVIQSFQRPGTTAPVQAQSIRPGAIFAFAIFAMMVSQGFPRNVTTRADSSESASVVAVLGHSQQIASAPVFRGAEMTSIMGKADLDLRNTTVAPGDDPEIELFTLLGGATVRVPEGWNVDVRAAPLLGGVKDRRTGARDEAGAPRIIIRGFIMLGALDIRTDASRRKG
jgi:hypothetical protein